MKVTLAVKEILSDPRCEMSSEIINMLHSSCVDHPWGKGKSEEERKLNALCASAQAKYIPVTLLRKLEIS